MHPRQSESLWKKKPTLTILSVSFHSAQYLRRNRELTELLNASRDRASWEWIVVDNTPQNNPERLSDGEGFEILEGVAMPNLTGHGKGSYHHAMALHKGLLRVKGRFLLVLDPDFYITKKNWMDMALSHMAKHGLAFFGAPWHPRHNKYRYFPCVHCLFIDLEKIPLETLDFTPDLDVQKEIPLDPFPQRPSERQHVRTRILSLLSKILRFFLGQTYEKMMKSVRVGYSRDTGYRIYERFSHNKHFPFEVVTPVDKSSRVSTIFSALLPDKYSALPKKIGYSTKKGVIESPQIDSSYPSEE